MTKKDVNIAMVGYYNTLPFLYGLEQNESFNLILDIPSRCMEYYDSRKAEIALVPVATLMERTDYKIVTDYCIGCIGAVRTVCLFTNGNISEVSKIYLDKDSRTSQLLVKTLCKNSWNIQPTFVECDVLNMLPEELKLDEAVLMIGDKVFEKEGLYKYCLDLGEEWQNLSGLPFTFAVWIARKDMDSSILKELNHSLSLGVRNMNAVLEQNKDLATKIELSEYFNSYIDFHFDSEKEKALDLFFELNGVVHI